MDEYIPYYLKNNEKCPRCDKKLNKKKILAYSYMNECKKCSNMSMYGDNHINNNNELLYVSCSCKTEYIYKYIIKCDNCIKCNECKNELTYNELKYIKNVDSHHLCIKCYNKNNYNISENVNY